jgi:guanyl-specific ribonuclease Sa
MKKALAALLAALASLLLLTGRVAADRAPAATMRADRSPREGDLARQIAAVIDSMDRSGRPPTGVAQGGRRAGRRGVFENAEGRLPPQPRGYYTETDVWPRGPGGRGAQRLIFGKGGEVYYTADHYRTFRRVR